MLKTSPLMLLSSCKSWEEPFLFLCFPFCFFKWAILGLFLFIFIFSNKQYNSHNKYRWKMSCPSRTWPHPQHLEHKSPPITIRPGLRFPFCLANYFSQRTITRLFSICSFCNKVYLSLRLFKNGPTLDSFSFILVFSNTHH